MSVESHGSLPAAPIPLAAVALQYVFLMNNAHKDIAFSPIASQLACISLQRVNSFLLGVGFGIKDLPELDPDDTNPRTRKDPSSYYLWYFSKYAPALDKMLGIYIAKVSEAQQAAYDLPRIQL